MKLVKRLGFLAVAPVREELATEEIIRMTRGSRHSILSMVLAVVVILAGSWSQAAWADNAITNGDFESGFTSGVADDWTTYDNCAPTFASGAGTSPTATTAQQISEALTTTSEYYGIYQTITDVNIGDAFTFNADVWSLEDYHYTYCALRVDWDGGTSRSGATELCHPEYLAEETWTSMGYGSGNATGTSVTLFVDVQGAEYMGTEVRWDNVVAYHAHVPPAPTLRDRASSSVYVDVEPGGNSGNSEAEYAITIGGGGYTLGTAWVQSNGTISTSEVVWQTNTTWGDKQVTGLSAGTVYLFKVKARYSDTYTQETSLGTEASTGELMNDGMEEFTSGAADEWTKYWKKHWPVSWNYDGTIKSEGDYSQRIHIYDVAAPKTKYVGLYQTIDANVGDTITFEAYGRTYHNNTIYAGLFIGAQWDGSTDCPESQFTGNGSGGNEVFFPLTVSGYATEKAVTAFLHAQRNGDAGDDNLVWFDEASTYHAYVPPAPTVSNRQTYTVDVNINAGSNWEDAEYAITIGGGDYILGTHWIDTSGTVGTSPAWQTDEEWDTQTVTVAESGTVYYFKATARYDDDSYDQPTQLGSAGSYTSIPFYDPDQDGLSVEEDNCPYIANVNDGAVDCNSDGDTDDTGEGDEEQCDQDGDGVGDMCDNCPDDANVFQTDSDGDEWGDVCDNCPNDQNPEQWDCDDDGIGDICDPSTLPNSVPTDCNGDLDTNDPGEGVGEYCDEDGDDIPDVCDNCETVYNPTQSNYDSDDYGDACDSCPLNTNSGTDADDDDIDDVCDNCVGCTNPDQEDEDFDDYGNNVTGCTETCTNCSSCDNCPHTYNPDQTDTDEDGTGDACELGTLTYVDYSYDEYGRVTSVERNEDGYDLIAYEYDGLDMTRRRITTEYADNATGVTGPADVYIDYDVEHDNHRRITTIANIARTSATSDTYQLATFSYAYDGVGNRTQDTGSRPTSGSPLNAVGFAEARDVDYSYDTLNRVTQAAYTYPASVNTDFDYDLLGNRENVYDTLNSVTFNYDHNAINEYTELVTNTVTQGYAYDDRGNLTQDEGLDDSSGSDYMDYDYDLDNQLTKISYDSGSGLTVIAEYRYDALGRRIEYADHVRDVTTRYYYDGQSIVADYTYNGSTETPAREYVNGAGYIDERAVMRDVSGDGQDHYYLLKDLYTVTGLVGSNGELEEAYVYDTYGDATIYAWPLGDLDRDGDIDDHDEDFIWDGSTGIKTADGTATDYPFADFDRDGDVDDTDLSTLQTNRSAGLTPVACTYSSVDNPFLFTGRLTDTLEADDPYVANDSDGYRRIQQNRIRFYDLKHGRWLQREPLEYLECMNLYVYVASGPTRWVDPSGAILEHLISQGLSLVNCAASEVGCFKIKTIGGTRSFSKSRKFSPSGAVKRVPLIGGIAAKLMGTALAKAEGSIGVEGSCELNCCRHHGQNLKYNGTIAITGKLQKKAGTEDIKDVIADVFGWAKAGFLVRPLLRGKYSPDLNAKAGVAVSGSGSVSYDLCDNGMSGKVCAKAGVFADAEANVFGVFGASVGGKGGCKFCLLIPEWEFEGGCEACISASLNIDVDIFDWFNYTLDWSADKCVPEKG